MATAARAATRLLARTAIIAGAVSAMLLVPATPARAHPLGNFTINQFSGLVFSPTGVVDHAVIDTAELPTIQQQDTIDTDGDQAVSRAERTAFAATECAALAARLDLTIDGVAQTWTVGATDFSYRPGAAGLKISRLECRLSVAVDLSQESRVEFRDDYLPDRIGWREITASGNKMALKGAEVGSRSISDELRHYPNALLSSPLDQRSLSLSVVPGVGTRSTALPQVAPVGWTARMMGRVTDTLDRLVLSHTWQLGLLALLLSLILGASHAALPGHGKTIMAAYMIGTRGTPKDAFLIGATVTIAHTTGVLVLGVLFSVGATFAGESLLAALGVVSGLTVAAIGAGLLHEALTRSRHAGDQSFGQGHGQGHVHGHVHGHTHVHGPARSAAGDPGARSSHVVPVDALRATLVLPQEETHAPDAGDGHGHDRGHHDEAGPGPDLAPEAAHPHARSERGFRRLTLVGMGLAGGLVPSPTALVVLLGTIALGRTAFGVLLVLAYGVGMAATLIVVGYLIARMPGRLSRLGALAREPVVGRLVANGPVLTACLVIVVGLGLALRSGSPFV